MTKLRTPLVLATLAALFTACAQTDAPELDPAAESPAVAQTPTPDSPVSEAALAIEQAQRLLDRGGDPDEALAHLERALAAPTLSEGERADAVVALSRAHELAGRSEKAIAVLEEELASKRIDAPDALRRRLRKLLQSEELPAYLGEQRPTPNLARTLSRYFPVENDKASIQIFLFGGDRAVSEDVGTFNLAAALRADREQSCPLCSAEVGISQGIHRGDWVSIPENRSKLADALVVFYFDLEHNRIPARYESLLPMPVAEIEAELEAGHSFVVADERAEAPPVLLLAAPRAALLADLERRVATLEELPAEPLTFDIDTQIRATEIRSAVRGAWVPKIRSCYEALREDNPAAEGKLTTTVDIDGDGKVMELGLEPTPKLDDETFLACVQSSGEGLRFPAIGKKTTFRYPLVLSGK